MRTSLLRPQLAASGASFRERHGAEVVARFGDRRAEYLAVREAVGVTDFSFVRSFRVGQESGLDWLEGLLAGNVPKIRYGRLLHTFLADEEGLLVADCYVANHEEDFIFLCESAAPDERVDALLRAGLGAPASFEELTASHAVLSVDGFKAWEVVKELFGPDVLGLPYLSIETYPFAGGSVRLIRAGRTSEFGYLLLAPQSVAPVLFEAVKSAAEKRGGRLCGVEIHDDLRLEGRFFNIQAEGLCVRDPLVLGLQWMIDFDKAAFSGGAAIRQRRSAGLQRKIVGVAGEPGADGLAAGATIYQGGAPVAEVVCCCHSFLLGRQVGLAVFPVSLAYAGLRFRLGAADGPWVKTLSMPPIMPRSLSVKLDEM